MKRFLKKRWHGIPIGIIAVLILAGIVAAGTYLCVTQTITQKITDYGSITIAELNLTLSDIEVGDSMTWPSNPEQWNDAKGAVTVVVGPDGVDKWLHLTIAATTAELYDAYMVGLYSPAAQNPMNEIINLQVRFGFPAGFPDILEASVLLTEPGTYTFNESVSGTAGSASGTADVVVTITLEDDPA